MKVTLKGIGNLTDATTAQSTLNSNNQTIEDAFNNTLSLDGTQPNQMNSELDMNSRQIINLPQAATANSPLRLQDLNTFIGGGTITNIPPGGTTGQVLGKNSNANYDLGYLNSVTSVGLVLPSDFTITNSPVTSSGSLTGSWVTPPTGTGAVVRAASPTVSSPAITGHPTVEGVTSTGATGTGKFVFDTSPTLVTPALGTPASGVATNLTGTAAGLTAGNVTTNANLTGVITSVGNATSIASQTGTGTKFVTDNTPTLITPVLGAATATSVNKMAITAPVTSSTLAVANGKTFTANNTLTLAGTDSTTLTFQGTDTYVGRTTTDTLANKSISGSSNTLTNIGNAALTNSSVTYGTTAVALGASSTTLAGLTGVSLTSAATEDWNSDTYIGRSAAANLRLGQADAASPVAQTLSVQNVVAGTSNTAGTALSIAGSQGTGTGNGGSVILKTARAGTTGTAQNALTSGLTLDGVTGGVAINTTPVGTARLLVEDGTGANSQLVLRYTGKSGFAITQVSTGATNFGLADNATLAVYSNNGSGGYIQCFGDGGFTVGTSATSHGTSNLFVTGSIGSSAPVTKTGTSGTVGAAEGSTIFNASGAFTVTLPAAASYPGRWWYAKNIAAQTVTSATSNIVPLAGGAAATTLFAATAGKWANLQSDGTNWIIMASN